MIAEYFSIVLRVISFATVVYIARTMVPIFSKLPCEWSALQSTSSLLRVHS